MYFTSNLVDNGPLGSGFGGILCDFSASTKTISYIFNQPRDINGTYTFNYHVIDTVSMYYPKGFVSNGTNFNTTNSAGAIDISAGAVIPLTAVAGAPAARVLFILEFIGYV